MRGYKHPPTRNRPFLHIPKGTQRDPKGPRGTQRAPRGPKGAFGALGGMGPWGPLGLFRSHSEWEAISSGRLFQKKSHSEMNTILKETNRRRMNGFRAEGSRWRGALCRPWPKMDKIGIKTDDLDLWEARGPKLSKIIPKLIIWKSGWPVPRNGSNLFKRDPPRVSSVRRLRPF